MPSVRCETIEVTEKKNGATPYGQLGIFAINTKWFFIRRKEQSDHEGYIKYIDNMPCWQNAKLTVKMTS
jgi:hypothetical protein